MKERVISFVKEKLQEAIDLDKSLCQQQLTRKNQNGVTYTKISSHQTKDQLFEFLKKEER
jgi:hypothetical protein